MTPEDVLAAIRTEYRLAVLEGWAAPQDDLVLEILEEDWQFDTRVRHWRTAYLNCWVEDPLFPWPGLNFFADGLNEWFGITASHVEWEILLDPTATLRDVCQLVADKGARRPVARPCRLLGTECRTAGAFLALRALLAEAGVPIRDVRPSTPLPEVARRHLPALMREVWRLDPEALPFPDVRPHALGAVVALLGFAELALLGIGCRANETWLVLTAFVALVVTGGLLHLAGRLPRSVNFEGVRTFADLARRVARSGSAFA
jgi:hypothetical protein